MLIINRYKFLQQGRTVRPAGLDRLRGAPPAHRFAQVGRALLLDFRPRRSVGPAAQEDDGHGDSRFGGQRPRDPRDRGSRPERLPRAGRFFGARRVGQGERRLLLFASGTRSGGQLRLLLRRQRRRDGRRFVRIESLCHGLQLQRQDRRAAYRSGGRRRQGGTCRRGTYGHGLCRGREPEGAWRQTLSGRGVPRRIVEQPPGNILVYDCVQGE